MTTITERRFLTLNVCLALLSGVNASSLPAVSVRTYDPHAYESFSSIFSTGSVALRKYSSALREFSATDGALDWIKSSYADIRNAARETGFEGIASGPWNFPQMEYQQMDYFAYKDWQRYWRVHVDLSEEIFQYFYPQVAEAVGNSGSEVITSVGSMLREDVLALSPIIDRLTSQPGEECRIIDDGLYDYRMAMQAYAQALSSFSQNLDVVSYPPVTCSDSTVFDGFSEFLSMLSTETRPLVVADFNVAIDKRSASVNATGATTSSLSASSSSGTTSQKSSNAAGLPMAGAMAASVAAAIALLL